MSSGFIKRSIATFLFICMMFTVMPAEFMTIAFADYVGESQPVTFSPAGVNNTAGGTYKGNTTLFRIVLSRNPENFLNGTEEQRDKVRNAYKTKYPNDSDLTSNTMFLWAANEYDWAYNKKIWDGRAGTGNYVDALDGCSRGPGVMTYDPSASPNGLRYWHQGYKALNFKLNYRINANENDANTPRNYVKENIMAAFESGAITDLTDLTDYRWLNYLPANSGAHAKEVVSYIFHQVGGLGGEYHVSDRIERFIEKDNKPGSKAEFDKDPKELSHREKVELGAGYLSFLITLYCLPGSEDPNKYPVLADLAGTYEAAINDYCANANTVEKPVSVVIDTASSVVEENVRTFAIPTIDYAQFTMIANSVESLTEPANIIGPQSPGDTYTQLLNILRSSVARVPVSETFATKGSNASVQRIADDEVGVNSPGVRHSALGHCYRITFANHEYLQTTASNGAQYTESPFTSKTDYITFNDQNGVKTKGFLIVGQHIANPVPTASYFVDSTVNTTMDVCGDTVQLKDPLIVKVNISGNSSLISSLDARKDREDFSGLKIESEVFRTVSINGTTKEGDLEGFMTGKYETDLDSGVYGERMPEMEKQLNMILKGDELIDKISGTPIVLKDNSVLKEKFNRPVSSSSTSSNNYTFRYYINLKLSLDNAQGDKDSENPAYFYNYLDIVTKDEGGSMDNLVEVVVPKQVDTIPEAIDVQPLKPDSPTTTEIVNPSDEEHLDENTQMLRRFSFYTEGEEFAEIKSNQPLNEEFEVMGGIPSSEELYFSVGGSEFKLAMIIQYWMNEHSRDRTYTIHFDGTKCEYNNEGEGTGDRMPETFPIAQPAYGNGAYTDKSVHCFNENHTGDFDEVIVAEWSGNDKATCVPQYFSCNCGTQLHSHHSLTTPTYDAALADANRLVAELNAEDVVWTSASDKLERKQKWTASITTDTYDWSDITTKGDTGKWCGSHGHSSGTHGSGENSYSCGSGSHSTGSACTNKHEWHIVVTATIPKHSVCGPCCGHHMPELWDTWRQGLVYDFAKISQVRLFKLDQGSVDGLQELTGVDTVFANVVSGNPTYFMNIAQLTEKQNKASGSILPANYDKTIAGEEGYTAENLTSASLKENVITYYSGANRRAAQSSRAGRLRYILDPNHATSDTISYDEEGDGSGGSYTIDYNLVAAPNQHDDVYYHVGTRSTNCDGMATSGNFGKNLSDVLLENQSTKIGHENEWADGCLYTNVIGKTVQAGITDFTANPLAYSGYWDPAKYQSGGFVHNTGTDFFLYKNDEYVSQYKEDYNHHIHRENSVAGVANAQWNGNTVKVAYSDAADIRDMDTPEWNFFDKARRTKIIANVISDFLILQTSGGDQSIFYFEKATKPTEAQQHFDKVISHNKELFRDNPLSIFTGDLACEGAVHVKPEISQNFIMVGGYNGLYNRPADKYRPYSPTDPTDKLKNFSGWTSYDATTKSGDYSHYGNSSIKTILDADPAKTINRPNRTTTGQSDSFKILQDHIQILPTAPNKLYTPYNGRVFYSQVLGFYSIDNGVHDVEGNNKTLVGTQGNVKIGWDQITQDGEMYKKFWGNKNGVDNETDYYRTMEGDKGGSTVNQIVVFTPVSTEDAIVMEQDKLPIVDNTGRTTYISRDQRANRFDYPNMNDLTNKLKVCPLDPEMCEYRFLDCKYYKDRVVADFDFSENYYAKERVYADDGTSEIKEVLKKGTYTKDGRWFVTNKVNGIEYALPSGFSVITNGSSVGSGWYLSAQGDRWVIPFSDLGITNGRSNKLRVEMDLTVISNEDKLMLVGFKDYGFILNKNNGRQGIGSFIARSKNYPDEIGPRFDVLKSSAKGYSNVKLSITFGFNNIIDCTATIDGVPIKDTELLISELRDVWGYGADGITRVLEKKQDFVKDLNQNPPIDITATNPPEVFVTGDIGQNLTIGGWLGGNELYKARYYIDNLKIVLEGGDHNHNSTCYERIQTHATSMIHTHTDACKLDGDMYICDGILNAGYTCNGVLNTHTHNSTCYTNVSNNTITLNNNASTSKKFLAKTSGTLTLAGYGSCTAETWTANVKVNGVQKYNYNSCYAGSFTYNFSAGDIVEFTASIRDSCSVGWTISWTAGAFGEMTGNCTGNLNSHTHTGVANKDYPNGCYDIATEHRHDNQPILCGKQNVVGSHIHTDACLGDKIGEVKKEGYTQYTYKRLTCNKSTSTPDPATNYSYSASTKTYTVSNLPPGRYKFEVWGAQGGSSVHAVGGKGGYSMGYYESNTTFTAYVYLGGAGGNGNVDGGHNGGGHGGAQSVDGSSGGGGTDIRIGGTALSNRVIVAGGGGGGGCSGDTGGAGGGTTGGTGKQPSGYGTGGAGGSSTTGHKLGIGQDSPWGGGGGGGYWGGYAGTGHSGGAVAGGGGSGYVGGVKNGVTTIGTSQITEPNGTLAYGHSGHGYARITPQQHTHTEGSCYTQVTFDGCSFMPEGSVVCTGELNTKTDFNVHVHNDSCLTSEATMEPKMLRYTGDVQAYVAPWEDEYLIQVWGAELNGRTGYAKGKVKLKAGQKLYAYVGGTDGYNNGRSDVRLVPLPGKIYEDDIPQEDNYLAQSEKSRLLSAGKTYPDANTFYNTSVGTCVLTNGKVGVKGGDGSGRVLITPSNNEYDILENIVAGNYTEEENRMYLGDELADKIYSDAKSFKTWDNWSVFNTKGVTPYADGYKDTHIMFSNNNIIYEVRKDTPEFYIPVNLEAKTLRQVKVTFDNNTSATNAKIYANSVSESNSVSAEILANTKNQEITFMISNKWDALAISKLYFDLSVGTKAGSIVVKKIELLGQAASVSNIDDATYQNTSLLNLNNFSSSDTKGFTALSNAELSYSGGKMSVKHTSSNPTIKWGNITKISTSAIEYIKLKVQTTNTSSSKGYLYYGGSTSGNKTFYWHMGGSSYGEQTIYIDVNSKFSYNETTGQYYNSTGSWWSNWTGDITDIRFQFTNGSGYTTTISSIEFIGQGTTSGTGGYVTGTNAGVPTEYPYVKGSQNITLDPGTYRIEAWGAAGSGADPGIGGNGGYISGDFTFNSTTTLYYLIGQGGWYAGGTLSTQSRAQGFGGGGYGYGGGGGGGTFVYLNNNINTKSNLLLVAGGGGGAADYCGSGQTQPIGHGGYYAAYGNLNGTDALYRTGGTQSSGGYNLGGGYLGNDGSYLYGGDAAGGSGSQNSGGGGGGGYYGGAGGGADSDGGGGGSSYINTNYGTLNSSATATLMTCSENHGTGQNGKLVITSLVTADPVTITSNITTKKYLTATYKDPFKEVGTREFILDNWELIPDRIDGGFYNPIWKCKFKDLNEHRCSYVNGYGVLVEYCKNYLVFNCTEPHHKDEHYPGSNAICWSACGKDENHVNTKKEVELDTGEKVKLANFLQLDSAFTVYFPNVGDFAGTNPNRLGLAAPQIDRAKGYTNNMDTTDWTREKRVRFPFDVIYDNKETEEFETYFGGTWIELDVETEYFNFYLPVSNYELSNAKVEFEVEAINCGTASGLNPKKKLEYTQAVSTTYANKLSEFRTKYIDVLLNAIKSGYKVPYTTTQQANESKGKNFDESGYWNFYTAKSTGIENALRTAMETTDLTIEADFEGKSGTKRDYVYPHDKYSSRNDSQSGLNWKLKPITANDNKHRVNNRMRSNSFESLHGGFKSFYLDVIGRIGNFSITDTDDFRFSNFFKVPLKTSGDALKDANAWLVEGLVRKVDDGIQNFYIGDSYDIRGTEVSQVQDNNNTLDINNKSVNGGLPKGENMSGNKSEIKWLDTYNTQSWMRGVYRAGANRDTSTPNLKDQILTAQVNNIEILKDEELRYGYDVYDSIVTMGDYRGGRVQVIPKYYALRLKGPQEGENIPAKYQNAGEYYPIDVYINKDGVYSPVNVHNNAINGKPNLNNLDLYNYVFNLDWTNETARRNYTMEEKNITETVQQYLSNVKEDVPEDTVDNSEYGSNKEYTVIGEDLLEIPKGRNNYLGTAQYILMDSRHRTFVGNTYSFGSNYQKSRAGDTYWGAYKNPNGILPKEHFAMNVQRWHSKLGIPSSSVFVPTGMQVNSDTTKYVMNDNFAIICTAEIIAIGPTWSLYYSQPWFKTLTINGVNYETSEHYPGCRGERGEAQCPDCIPPIIAVYSSDDSSVGDVEITQTH